MTEDEMVGWHHRFNAHELGKLREMVKDRSLACRSPWGCKELDTTEVLNSKRSRFTMLS